MGPPALTAAERRAWQRINEEQDRQSRDAAAAMSVGERIERGLLISSLAHDIRSAVTRAGDVRSA